MWQDILLSVSTSGVVTGVFVAIIRAGIKNRFEKDLAAYKDKLKLTSDIEILKLTKDLELKASVRNIKLEGIFTRRAEIIAECHSNLISLYYASLERSQPLGAPPDHKEQSVIKLNVAYGKFKSDYVKNSIYIPKHIRGTINEIVNTIQDKTRTTNMFEQFLSAGHRKEEVLERFDNKINDLQTKLVSLLETLELKFDKILGSDEE